jgi:hypothetical protein
MPQIGDLREGVCRDLGVGDDGPAVFGGVFPMGMSDADHSGIDGLDRRSWQRRRQQRRRWYNELA